MGCTSIVGYDFLQNQEVNQHLRDNDYKVSQTDDGQVPEEKVYGGLKLRVNTGEGDNTHVPCHEQPILTRKTKKKGIWSSGRSEILIRMNSIT